MNHTGKFLPCEYKRSSCAAYHCGYCKALNDTHFKDKQCRFYKSNKQNAAERAACRERLQQLGLDALTEKYERKGG